MSLKWTSEVESLCENLRINCVNLSEYHRRRYYRFKSYGKYFRLPMIVLASINATASVGLQPILDQVIISGITCLIGMIMGIIGAIELYMGIQTTMELELKQSKEFYSLAIDLYKVLSLRRENRGEEGKDYLNKKYAMYTKLCEASNLLKRKLKVDLLTTIPEEYEDKSRSPTPIQDYQHEQQMLAMQEFADQKTWYQSLYKYLCCCCYDEDDKEFYGKNLQLYNFPNHREEFINRRHSLYSNRYYAPYEKDLENQQDLFQDAEADVLLLENTKKNVFIKPEDEKDEILENNIEEKDIEEIITKEE